MGVFKRNGGKNWYIDFWYQGKRIRQCIGSSKTLAKKALQVRKAQIIQGKFNLNMDKDDIGFDKLCCKYLEYVKSYKKDPRADENSIKNLLRAFGGMKLNHIMPLHIEEYKIRRLKYVKPSSINRELAVLRYSFNLGIKWGYTYSNPMGEIKLYKENNERVRFLSPEQARKLVSSCAGHLRPIVIVALNTGMRRGEIFDLLWQDIDFTHRIISVTNTKNGDTRRIPCNDIVHKLLLQLASARTSDYVFPSAKGGRLTSVKRSFSTAVKLAGIDDFKFHDIRHEFASKLIMAGVDLVTVKEILGHKSIRMTLRYSHLSNTHKFNAVQKLVDNGCYLETTEQSN